MIWLQNRSGRGRRWMLTAGVMAVYCLFSFGTAKLRARIHQQRRQVLVLTDTADRMACPAPALAVAMPTATAAQLVVPLPLYAGPVPESLATEPVAAHADTPAPRGPPIAG